MLIHENRVPAAYRAAFVKRVREISAALGINPNWLMQIMYWESAKTFSPSVKNPSGATGLIQFMPSTAAELGTTTAALAAMSAVQQLDYVYKYYKMWYKRLGISSPQSFGDTYLITFFPLAVNKADSFILQTAKLSAALIATQNPAFDFNKDGKVTAGEVRAKMLTQIPKEWVSEFVKKKV